MASEPPHDPSDDAVNRDELAALVRPIPASRTAARATVEVANPVRDALTAHFTTPEGIRDLADAPRVNGTQITAEEAVEALVEEARGL